MLLIEQSRYQLAEQELRQSLAQKPDDALAHAVLAICLTHLDQNGPAMREAELGISFAPSDPFAHYAKSIVEVSRNCFDDARQAIRHAIGLDPDNTDYFAQMARIELEQQHWHEALTAAEEGLQRDPEDIECTNLRAIALTRLGRRAEAGETIQVALKRNPENAESHANMGWALLEDGQPQRSLEHFRESLRLDPESDWAREGVVEAMKARYLVYRIVLAWFIWMLGLSSRTQWLVLVGAFAAYQVLRRLAEHNPHLLPWLMPLLIAYATFALMTWVASPLLHLILRMNRFGRLALTREQITTSNWVGSCMLAAIVSLVGYGLSGNINYLLCAITCVLIIPPLAHIYSCSEGWPRAIMIEIAGTLLLLALVILISLPSASLIAGPLGKLMSIIGYQTFLLFVFGALAAQFAVNALLRVRPRPGSITTTNVWVAGGTLLALFLCLYLGYFGWLTLYLFRASM